MVLMILYLTLFFAKSCFICGVCSLCRERVLWQCWSEIVLH